MPEQLPLLPPSPSNPWRVIGIATGWDFGGIHARWECPACGCTVGGSEYYRDPDACVAAIRNRFGRGGKAQKEAARLRRRVAELEADIDGRVAICPECGEVEQCDEDRCCLSCGHDLVVCADRHAAEVAQGWAQDLDIALTVGEDMGAAVQRLYRERDQARAEVRRMRKWQNSAEENLRSVVKQRGEARAERDDLQARLDAETMVEGRPGWTVGGPSQWIYDAPHPYIAVVGRSFTGFGWCSRIERFDSARLHRVASGYLGSAIDAMMSVEAKIADLVGTVAP